MTPEDKDPEAAQNRLGAAAGRARARTTSMTSKTRRVVAKRVPRRGQGRSGDEPGDTKEHVNEEPSRVARAVSDRARAATSRVRARLAEQRLPRLRQVELTALAPSAKLLYCRALVAQARIDGPLDPRELASLFLMATTIDLDAESRAVLREDIGASDEGPRGQLGDDVPALAERLSSILPEDDRVPVLAMLACDLLRMARADGEVTAPEREAVEAVAGLACPGQADVLLAKTSRVLDEEEAFLAGRISQSRLASTSKDIVAGGAAVGVPLVALGVVGSGSGAAAITSGLATIGVRRLAGISKMHVGVGTLLIIGVATNEATKLALGHRRREWEARREQLIQAVLRHHQDAIAVLSADHAELTSKVDEAVSRTKRNEMRLSRQRAELAAFELALDDLSARYVVLAGESDEHAA